VHFQYASSNWTQKQLDEAYAKAYYEKYPERIPVVLRRSGRLRTIDQPTAITQTTDQPTAPAFSTVTATKSKRSRQSSQATTRQDAEVCEDQDHSLEEQTIDQSTASGLSTTTATKSKRSHQSRIMTAKQIAEGSPKATEKRYDFGQKDY